MSIDNKPLTKDELMKMKCQPVWVVTDKVAEWCILHSWNGPEVVGRSFIFTRWSAEKRSYIMDDMFVTWNAYRHPFYIL